MCVIVEKYLISQFRSAHRIERGEAATRVGLTMAIADFPEANFDTAPPLFNLRAFGSTRTIGPARAGSSRAELANLALRGGGHPELPEAHVEGED